MWEFGEKISNMIQNRKVNEVLAIIKNETDYRKGEMIVSSVLYADKSTPELLEAVLDMFHNTRKNSFQQHGDWVHSLSHFTKQLWNRRTDKWIKKFYETAFKGANELSNSNCSNRLVDDFAWHASWNDDLADFGLTPENLRWMANDDSEFLAYAQSRIKASPFASEEAFLRWKLNRPETHTIHDFEAQTYLVDVKGMQTLILQLEQFGADTDEFKSLVKELLTKKLSELEEKVLTSTIDWEKERINKGLNKTKEALVTFN